MKLDGVRVIDLSQFLPGPMLTLVMADHGAEVIKVEPPGGEHGRRIGAADGPDTVFFRNLNRGKRGLSLDLKRPEDRETLLGLCADADVFVESFRPGVAARLGVGYDEVAARNPGIVYCSISAFGQDGPYRNRPAHDLAVEGIAGALSLNLGADGQIALPGLPAADISAALYGLSGVLMALLRRQMTGRGDYLDLSMYDALLGSMLNVVGPVFAEGRQPDVPHDRNTGGSAFYHVYDTADGRQIALAGQEPRFVRALLEALERPDLIDCCERGPGAHQQPVIDFLAGVFRQHPASHWATYLDGLGVCWGPVNDLVSAFEDPHLLSRGSAWTDGDGRHHIGTPLRFTDEPGQPAVDGPAVRPINGSPAWLSPREAASHDYSADTR